MASHADDHYYVPHHSHWPIVGSIGLLFPPSLPIILYGVIAQINMYQLAPTSRVVAMRVRITVRDLKASRIFFHPDVKIDIIESNIIDQIIR